MTSARFAFGNRFTSFFFCPFGLCVVGCATLSQDHWETGLAKCLRGRLQGFNALPCNSIAARPPMSWVLLGSWDIGVFLDFQPSPVYPCARTIDRIKEEKGGFQPMSIEDFVEMCERVMRRAAEVSPESRCLQNMLIDGGEETNRTRPFMVLNSKPTVLLVENEPGLLDALRDVLQGQGYMVLAAPSGEFALRICAGYGGRIDVLVCDVVVDRWNGFEVPARVKGLFPEVFIVLMSGSPREAFLKALCLACFFRSRFLIASCWMPFRGTSKRKQENSTREGWTDGNLHKIWAAARG